MNIHYKIIEVNPDEHSIVVRYFTDVMTEEMLATIPDATEKRLDGSPIRCRSDYNINVPVPAPEGQDLENFILSKAPVYWLDLQEKILNPNIDTTLSAFKDLINVKKTVDVEFMNTNPEQATDSTNSLTSAPATNIDTTLTDDDILELLEKAKQGKAA